MQKARAVTKVQRDIIEQGTTGSDNETRSEFQDREKLEHWRGKEPFAQVSPLEAVEYRMADITFVSGFDTKTRLMGHSPLY